MIKYMSSLFGRKKSTDLIVENKMVLEDELISDRNEYNNTINDLKRTIDLLENKNIKLQDELNDLKSNLNSEIKKAILRIETTTVDPLVLERNSLLVKISENNIIHRNTILDLHQKIENLTIGDN